MIIRSSLAACAAVALLASLAACAPAAPPVDQAKAADGLRAVEADWVKAFNTHQNQKVLGYYAADAISDAPGGPAAVGADAIKQSYASTFADPGFNLVFAPDKVEVAKSGDMAYTAGRYRQVTTDPKTKAPVVEVGNYVTVYKKQADGSWKAVADINTPGPGTVPPTTP